MDEPYRPPAAAPPPDEEVISVRRKRIGAVVPWLAGVAIFVGVGLIFFLPRNGIFSELGADNFQAGYPGFLRKLVTEFPEYPLGAGIILAVVALVSRYSGKLMLGLVLAFLAVGVIGGWAAVLLAALSHVIRGFSA